MTAVHFEGTLITCRATGCERMIPYKSFMCAEHWQSLPVEMQSNIARYEGKDFRNHDLWNAYNLHRMKAIQHIARQEGNDCRFVDLLIERIEAEGYARN